MQLKSLWIRRWDIGEPLKGEIEFYAKTGKISLNLNDSICGRLLAVIADETVNAARGVAENLTAEIIDASCQQDLISPPSVDADQAIQNN